MVLILNWLNDNEFRRNGDVEDCQRMDQVVINIDGKEWFVWRRVMFFFEELMDFELLNQ